MGEKDRSPEVSIRGIVIPTAWDNEGRALRVAIVTADEGQYEVLEAGKGRRLLDLLRQEVDALVRFEERAGQHAGPSGTVTVLSYVVLDTYDPDDDSFDDVLGESSIRESAGGTY